MKYEWDERINLHVADRIDREHAKRQENTAREILRRFREQPGVILADEVGMGKTFVALGVAVSVALSDSKRRPIVVMTPRSLREKWPSDYTVFQERCLKSGKGADLRFDRADRAVDFLRLLDDPPERRARIIFLTHGAMSRSMDDKWVKLAIIHQAIKGRRGADEVRINVARHAGELLQMRWIDKSAPELWVSLLRTAPGEWLGLLQRYGVGLAGAAEQPEDDPVPEAVCRALPGLDTDEIYETILRLPKRITGNYKSRIYDARLQIKKGVGSLWEIALQRLNLKLPLLILDEAHHLKNSQTRLATLFQTQESAEDARELSDGPLAGAFERMLFLTATPFHLGHNELCRVLERFGAVNWKGMAAPTMGFDEFRSAVKTLNSALNEAQENAVALDSAWGRLRAEDLQVGGRTYPASDAWWSVVTAKKCEEASPGATQVFFAYQRAKDSMRNAEEKLRPWVLRHLKPRTLSAPHSNVPRRRRFCGGAIIHDTDANGEAGLRLEDESVLPFLLAARAAAQSSEQRPVFAEGLASSYEAFLHTRQQRAHGGSDLLDEDALDCGPVDKASEWYLDCLERMLPRDDLMGSRAHPKVNATVKKAVDLWRAGEKVLVFCHYVATGRVLRRQISDALADEIRRAGALQLDCEPSDVEERLERIGERFFDADSPTRRACDREIGAILRGVPELADRSESLSDVVRRVVRTPSFLVRFFPLGSTSLDDSAIKEAFRSSDASGLSLREILHRFFSFLARQTQEERERYVEAVRRIQVGSHRSSAILESFGEDERDGDRSELLLPNVRLVNGATKGETRQRLMLTFNTPFYPEILIASSVMAEGVDLHLNCRYVIHHDLCWNPSMLEQRTGRVDRIGAKAEHCGKPIHIYLPYIAETQDEKMYRVVTDRERWFNVVMGEKYCVDARTTEKLAERIPLPAGVAESLAFDLTVEGRVGKAERE